MVKILKKRGTESLRIILPSELENMNESETVVVNRIRINVRLMEVENLSTPDVETIKILNDALISIKQRERIKTGAVLGARMTVGDIRKAFGDVRCMPRNTFVSVD